MKADQNHSKFLYTRNACPRTILEFCFGEFEDPLGWGNLVMIVFFWLLFTLHDRVGAKMTFRCRVFGLALLPLALRCRNGRFPQGPTKNLKKHAPYRNL